MAFRARVYLYRVPDAKPEYLGEVDLDQRPIRWSWTKFTYQGKRESGQIETVVPPAWETLGVTPVVHIVLQPASTEEREPDVH